MKSISGVFIPATDEQMNAIWTACALHGFAQDSKGALDLLMLAVHGDEEDEEEDEVQPLDPVQVVMEHLRANPQQAAILKEAGTKLFGGLMSKFNK